jgi:hypothetical protein
MPKLKLISLSFSLFFFFDRPGISFFTCLQIFHQPCPLSFHTSMSLPLSFLFPLLASPSMISKEELLEIF